MLMKYMGLIAAAFLFACATTTEINEITSSEISAFEDPPAWSKEVVWYQIFVERFRNGDPSNDPTRTDMEGTYPGFIPDNWKVTPWAKDWYSDDEYFPDMEKGEDWFGNPVTTFGSKVQLRRYGGDLQGVLDQIPYLDSLGITAVYFNPVNDAPSLHKYDPRYWRHVDRNFGPDPVGDVKIMEAEVHDDPTTWQFTEADKLFLKVVDELHRRNIRVIMDYSWNHTGHRFWAWNDLVKNQQQSKYKDWYWVNQFDDPQTEENEFEYRGWFGVKDLPEIRETNFIDHSDKVEIDTAGNIYSADAKQHIFSVAKRWLDPNGDGDPSDGVDGCRLDVAAEMPLGFWREFRKVVRAVNPETYLIGEVWWEKWPDDLMDPEPFLRGDVFDAQMNYRWYRAARLFFNASPIQIKVSDFADSLRNQRAHIRSDNNYAMMNLNGSHDTPRVLTSLFNKNPYKVNTHPDAENTYKVNKPDTATYETLRLLLAQQYTYIGAPHIWAGDEMGMWGSDDPSPRKPLIWPDYDFEMEVAHPNGAERPQDEVVFNHELFDYYRKLISIRSSYPSLRTGEIDFLVENDNEGIFAYRRTLDQEEVVSIFNISQEPRNVNLTLKGKYAELLNNYTIHQTGEGIVIQLPGRRAAILVNQE
jgi:cyclomaltodextrinase